MELDEIKAEYYKTLKELSNGSGRTIAEIDAEISEAIENCKNIEDILIKSSEIL